MAKRGRPPKDDDEVQGARKDLRMLVEEKEAFDLAAKCAGQSLSVWMRSRLREVARKELTKAGKPVAFDN